MYFQIYHDFFLFFLGGGGWGERRWGVGRDEDWWWWCFNFLLLRFRSLEDLKIVFKVVCFDCSLKQAKREENQKMDKNEWASGFVSTFVKHLRGRGRSLLQSLIYCVFRTNSEGHAAAEIAFQISVYAVSCSLLLDCKNI